MISKKLFSLPLVNKLSNLYPIDKIIQNHKFKEIAKIG